MSGPAVVLLGLMGAGKTSVGRELADRLEMEFTDLDQMIVEADGRTIPEIFRTEGEPGFRALEAATLAQALKSRRGILALGGGAAMHPTSRILLREVPVVLLEVDEAVVAARLGRGAGRPLLGGGDPMARWREIAHERLPVYRDLARWRIDAGAGNPGAVARSITDMMGRDLLVPDEEDV